MSHSPAPQISAGGHHHLPVIVADRFIVVDTITAHGEVQTPAKVAEANLLQERLGPLLRCDWKATEWSLTDAIESIQLPWSGGHPLNRPPKWPSWKLRMKMVRPDGPLPVQSAPWDPASGRPYENCAWPKHGPFMGLANWPTVDCPRSLAARFGSRVTPAFGIVLGRWQDV